MNLRRYFLQVLFLCLGLKSYSQTDCTRSNLVFADDYSNSSLWTTVDPFINVDKNGEVSVHNGAVNFTAGEWNGTAYVFPNCATGAETQGVANNRDVRCYRDIGTILSDFHWRSECKMKISTMNDDIYASNGGNGPGHIIMGFTSNNTNPQATVGANSPDFADCSASGSIGYTQTNNDGIFASLIAFGNDQVPSSFNDQPFPGNGCGWRIYGHAKNNSNNWWPSTNFANNCAPVSEQNWSRGIPLPALNTDYWIRLERINDGTSRISVFSDANMTQHIPGSPQCFNIDTDIQNLRYVQHAAHTSGTQFRSLNGTVDNIKVYDNCPAYPFTAAASPTTVCPGQPVTLSTSGAYPNEFWSPVFISGSPITVYPNTTTTYFAYAPMPGLGNQLAGNCVLFANVTVSVPITATLDPNFNIIVNAPGTGSTYSMSATPVTGSTNNDIALLNQQWVAQYGGNGPYGIWWEVSEVDCDDNSIVIPGTTMSNPANWWFTSPANNEFPGYNANSGSYDPTAQPPVKGNFLNCHCYRITRGVWGPCQSFTTSSYVVSSCHQARMITPVNYTPDFDRSISNSKISNSIRSEGPFNVIPNPNNGRFIIKLSELFLNSTIEIYNVVGKEVYKNKVTNNIQEIDISELKGGIYYIHVISSSGNKAVQKVVKE